MLQILVLEMVADWDGVDSLALTLGVSLQGLHTLVLDQQQRYPPTPTSAACGHRSFVAAKPILSHCSGLRYLELLDLCWYGVLYTGCRRGRIGSEVLQGAEVIRQWYLQSTDSKGGLTDGAGHTP